MIPARTHRISACDAVPHVVPPAAAIRHGGVAFSLESSPRAFHSDGRLPSGGLGLLQVVDESTILGFASQKTGVSPTPDVEVFAAPRSGNWCTRATKAGYDADDPFDRVLVLGIYCSAIGIVAIRPEESGTTRGRS